MGTYENLLLPVDDWYVTSTIHLDNNGCFRYHETWSCYAGSVDSKAEGKWEQTDNGVVLETQRIEGALRIGLAERQNYEVIKRGDCLDFGNGFVMTARHETGTN
jgi:hypothetical protein